MHCFKIDELKEETD